MSGSKYYKATRMDGTDFYSGTVDYAAALRTGTAIEHKVRDSFVGGASMYLSVSTSATDCTGFRWPCRLFEVEPHNEWTPEAESLPNKRATLSLRVVAEIAATLALGPQSAQLVDLFEKARNLTAQQVNDLSTAELAARSVAELAARSAARLVAESAARLAAESAARSAAEEAAGSAARSAARTAMALCVRDLITPEQYDILAGPWVSVMGDIVEATS